LRFDKGKETAIGFLMKNNVSKESLQTFANSIDDIERMIEIDFFSALPENQEKILERNSDVLEWSWD
jgi:endonuclease G